MMAAAAAPEDDDLEAAVYALLDLDWDVSVEELPVHGVARHIHPGLGVHQRAILHHRPTEASATPPS